MPIYEYKCQNCGNRFEVLQGVGEKPTGTEPLCCPRCKGTALTRVMSAAFTPQSKFRDSGPGPSGCTWNKKDGGPPGESGGNWPDNDDYVKLL
ncbi:MAG: FmdB family zinc ribbon protein [Desulfotomaculales bacterium]